MNLKSSNEYKCDIIGKVEKGVQLFGALKTAYDVGKSIYGVARVAAPYAARIASVL